MRPLQAPMFTPETEWVPPVNLPDLSQHKEIAIDLETKDTDLVKMGSGSVTGNGRITGIAVAVSGWSGYFPIAHEGGGNMDKGIVSKWLHKVLSSDVDKIFHNAMYDVCWLRSAGFKINGRIIDTMIASALVDENQMRYDLNSCARRYTGQGKDEAALYEAAKTWGVDAKAEMYKLPAMYVGAYAEKDAELTLALWQELKKEIDCQDIWNIWELETELFPCLVDMRFLGVRVNEEQALKEKKTLLQKEKVFLY